MRAIIRRMRCWVAGYHVIDEDDPRCKFCGKEWK